MTQYTPILNIPQVAPNQNQKEATINTGIATLEAAMNDKLAVDCSSIGGGGNLTLTTDQYTRYFLFVCSGQAGAGTLTVPATNRWFAVQNAGNFALTVGCAGAGNANTTVLLNAGKIALLISDGANIKTVVPGDGVGSLGDLSNVSVANPTDKEFLRFNATNNDWEAMDASDLLYFYNLGDVPNYKTGSGTYNGMLLQVAEDGSGLVWVTSSNNIHKFTDLTDSPGTYTGAAGLTVRVNPAATGLVFVQPKLSDSSDLQSYTSTDIGKYLRIGELTVNGETEVGVILQQPVVADLSDGPGAPNSAESLRYVRVNSAGDGLEYAEGTGGPDHFYQLADVPGSYTGHHGQVVRVNAAETGLEYWNFSLSFTGLSDAPQSYTGYAGKFLRVNAQANGVAFQTANTADLADGPGAPAKASALYVVRVNTGGTGLEYHQLNFTDLSGVPSSYTNQGGKFLAVKADGSGLQFVSSSVQTSFAALTDTPKSYTGQGGKILMVDGAPGGDGTGIVFGQLPSVPQKLEDLTDVAVQGTPPTGSVLGWNGTDWIATTEGVGGGSASSVALTGVGLHSYWRLVFLDTAGSGGYIALQSLIMAVNSTAPDLCGGGSVFASSAQPNGAANNAIAGINGADWRSTVGDEDNAFIGYHFDAPAQIGYVQLQASTSVQGQAPRGFVLQYSDDGTTYTTVYKVRGQSAWSASETRGFITPTQNDTFISLVDAPDSYVGSAGDFVRVKEDLSGVEFIPPPFIPLGLSQLSDVQELTTPNYADILAFGQDGLWHAVPAPNLLARDYGAHSHWRLRLRAQQDTGHDATQPIGLAEVLFFEAFDTFTNLATGGAPIESSEYAAAYTASNAFDGDPTTSWRSTVADGQSTAGPWIGYTFPNPVKVGAFTITVNATSSDWQARPGGAYVEFSDDGVSWLSAWYTNIEFPSANNTPSAPATLRLFSPAEVNLFTDLDDVPSSYPNGAKYVVRTNGGKGLEFHPLSVLTDLDDVEIGTNPAVTGDVLTYRDGVWVPESALNAQSVNAGGAHSYWRIRVGSVYSGATTSLAEVEFRGADGGPSFAVSGAPLSSNPTDRNAAQAFDGATSTAWVAPMDPQAGAYIGYQFPTAVSIVQLALSANANNSVASTDSPASFDVQISDDGVTWVTLKSFSVPSVSEWTTGAAVIFELPHGYDFINLLDAPQTYAGQGGAFVKVNASATGVEFADVMVPAVLGDLLDVEGASSPPQEGEVLAYIDGVWQPKFVDALTPESTIYVTEPGTFAPPEPGAFTLMIDPDGISPTFATVQGVGTILNGRTAGGPKGWRQFLKAKPGETTWSAYARLRPSFRNQPSLHFGLIVSNQTSGQFLTFGMTGGSGGWQLNTWNSLTQLGQTLASENWGWGADLWVRVDYANSLMTFSLSTNGQLWDQVASSNFTVPTHVGFGLHAEADSYTDVGQVSGTVLYYQDTDYQPQALDFFNKITQYVVEPGGFGPPGQHDLVLVDPAATGASYVAAVSGAIVTAPSVTTSTPSLVSALKPAPATTPWNARARLRAAMAAGEGRTVSGLCLYNQSTGRYLVFGPSLVNGVVRTEVSHWAGAASLHDVAFRGEMLTPGTEWYRVEVNGPTLSFYVSTNALSWVLVYQEQASAFIAGVDRIGAGVLAQTTPAANASSNSIALLYYADDTFTPQVPDPTTLSGGEIEPSLSELSDVSILTTPTDGQVLVWSSAKQRWVANEAPAPALNVSSENDNYTLALSDANSMLQMQSGALKVVEVPTNTAVPFPVGTQISLVAIEAGMISIGGATGVSFQYPADMKLQTRVQYSVVTLLKTGLNQWLVFGDLAAASS